MGVYVPLCMKRDERAARTSALVNSGYEAEEPELHVPLALAKKLSFSLEALKGAPRAAHTARTQQNIYITYFYLYHYRARNTRG